MGANQTKTRAPKRAPKQPSPALRAASVPAAREVPKFSFLIPCYMGPRAVGTSLVLGRCISSILDQTDPSWQIVLVHDGASPVARAFAEGLAEDCRRIGRADFVVYREAPYIGTRGGHQSVNVGLESCVGEFTTILNGDNTLRPHYIASMYDADADILIGSVRMNDMPGRILDGRAWHRGGIDRLNYSIRTGIAREVRHKMHLDADYDYLMDCWEHRNRIADVRVRYCEAVVAEHN